MAWDKFTYALYTDEGNTLCQTLLQPVIQEILDDKLTRKQAIARVREVRLLMKEEAA